MRISMREFVPGSWTVPQNPITGGMGRLAALADFVNGKFAVPQNPVSDARGMGDFVNGRFAVPQNPVSDANRTAVAQLAPLDHALGELTPSGPMYPIPMNSVLAAFRSQGMAGIGCGCGCGGSCGGCSQGMGDISTDLSTLSSDLMSGNFSKALGTDTIFSIPVWVYVAGVAVLSVAVFSGGEEHSRYGRAKRAAKAARSAYA